MECFQIGRAKVDCTPKALGQVLMGWGDDRHRALEIKEPLIIRCVWLKDGAGKSLLFFQYDICMISELLRTRFLEALTEEPRLKEFRLNETSFLFSATHSHAAPGGYCKEALYQAGSLGLDEEWIGQLVTKTREAALLASKHFQTGFLKAGIATIPSGLNLLHNRSLPAHLLNPDRLKSDAADVGLLRDFPVWRIESKTGTPLAMLSFLGLHGTCIHQDTKCIHPDHKGLASHFSENRFFREDPEFVALYLQGAAGDITPNFKAHTKGDMLRGVFQDDFKSATWVAEKQCEIAEAVFLNLKDSDSEAPEIQVEEKNVSFFDETDLKRKVVGPALGKGFLFGTAEGKIPIPWFSRFLAWRSSKLVSTPEQRLLHGNKIFVIDEAKRTLLFFKFSKKISIPPTFLHPLFKVLKKWKEDDVIDSLPMLPYTQRMSLSRIGGLYLIACPGEFTVQSSVRMKRALISSLNTLGKIVLEKDIVFMGYTNGYGSYVTTPEEYDLQRYEGSCTLYGRQTLDAYLCAVKELARVIVTKPTSGGVGSSGSFDPSRGDTRTILNSGGQVAAPGITGETTEISM